MYSEAPESTRVVGFGRGTGEFPMCGYTLTPGENRSQPVLFALVCSCMFLWYPLIVFNILLPAWFDFKHHMELQWLILLLSDSTTRPFSFKYHSFARFASSQHHVLRHNKEGHSFLADVEPSAAIPDHLVGVDGYDPPHCRTGSLSFPTGSPENPEMIQFISGWIRWMVDNRQNQKIMGKMSFFWWIILTLHPWKGSWNLCWPEMNRT